MALEGVENTEKERGHLFQPVSAPRVSCSIIALVSDRRGLSELLAAIESVHALVDECVVILDDRSPSFVDLELDRLGVRLLRRQWTDDFAAARNAAQELCRGEWILYIDSDERLVDEGNLRTLVGVASERKLDGVAVIVRAFSESGFGTDSRQLRLYRRSGNRWEAPIHEQLVGPKSIIGSTARIDALYPEATAAAKVARNLPMLLAMAEREPDNAKWAHHLTETYRAAMDTERMVYWAERCVEMAPESPFFVQTWVDLILARMVRVETGERSALATALRALTYHSKHPDLWHALAVIGLANWFHLAPTAHAVPTNRSARYASNLPAVAGQLGLPLSFPPKPASLGEEAPE